MTAGRGSQYPIQDDSKCLFWTELDIKVTTAIITYPVPP